MIPWCQIEPIVSNVLPTFHVLANPTDVTTFIEGKREKKNKPFILSDFLNLLVTFKIIIPAVFGRGHDEYIYDFFFFFCRNELCHQTKLERRENI